MLSFKYCFISIDH